MCRTNKVKSLSSGPFKRELFIFVLQCGVVSMTQDREGSYNIKSLDNLCVVIDDFNCSL